MELIFDHTLGKQEQQDLVICRPMAIVDQDEEAEAIDRGWLALDHPVMKREVFYQSRSTRIDIDKYKPRYKQHRYEGQDIGYKIIDASEEMVGLLKGINIVAKKLGISTEVGKGYRALANISDHGGQEVPHLHFHLFGGERVGKMVE